MVSGFVVSLSAELPRFVAKTRTAIDQTIPTLKQKARALVALRVSAGCDGVEEAPVGFAGVEE